MGPYYVVTISFGTSSALTKIAPQAKVPKKHGST